MTKKKTSALIDKGAPVIRKPKGTDVEKVQTTRSMTLAMQQSASWAAATDVQGAVGIWTKSADEIEANAKVIAKLKDQLMTAESTQRTLRRNWQASTSQVLSTVNVFCNGSVDLVKGFSFDVRTYAAIGAQAAPEGLIVATGKQPGEAMATWNRGTAIHGFVAQHATDASNAATHSAIVPVTRTKYTLGGSTSGSIVYLRIAAIDPNADSGIGPWTAWAGGTAK